MNRRNTPNKTIILDLLKHAGSALSQDKIEAEVKGVVDRVTIYRVLNRFCEDGITHRILADDGKYYFALCHSCTNDEHNHDHFHFRCVSCQKVECLEQHIEVYLPTGYTRQNSTSWVNGLCSRCN